MQAIFTLLALSLIVFLSIHLTGDPALYLLGPDSTKEDYEQLRINLGLDEPLVVQYGLFLSNIARGDFGRSHISKKSARDALLQRLPATFQLAGAAFLFTLVVGIPLGVISAVKRGSIIDNMGKLVAVLGVATPNFWLGIMLILLFAGILNWLPPFGRGGLAHFILPTFVLGTATMAGMVRLGRSSMLEVLDSEYVKFARVKGLSERVVIYKHALKNAVIPLLTFSGLTISGLLNGSVAVEVVFAWPGIGRLMLQAVNQRDFPVVQATVLAAGFFYIATSFAVDITYAYVNPRIRVDR